MTRVELTEEEARTLAEILESALAELKTEMVATENREWRADLKKREEFLMGFMNRLTGGEP